MMASESQPLLSTKSSSEPAQPKDRYYFISLAIFLFGIGSILPWKFFITASDFWLYKFRDVTQDFSPTANRTKLQADFNSYLSIASSVPNIIFLILNAAIRQKIRPSVRVGYSIFVCIVLFAAFTGLVEIDTDDFQDTFLAISLTIVTVMSMVLGFLRGGGIGLVGCFPKKYVAFLVYGQAAAGVFATAVELLTLLMESSPTDSALMYFSIALLTLMVTQICFVILTRTEFYRYYTSIQAVSYDVEVNRSKEKAKQPAMPHVRIFKAGWQFYLSSMFNLWVTLSVFPAVVVLTVSMHASNGSALTNKFFIPLACFTTFNVMDLLGRVLFRWFPIPAKMKTTILVITLARVGFIPLAVLCNARPRHLLPVLIPSDLAFVVIMLLFGLTNGYLLALTLTYASKSVSTEYQEAAGSMAAVFTGMGLMLGSVSSYGTVQVL